MQLRRLPFLLLFLPFVCGQGVGVGVGVSSFATQDQQQIGGPYATFDLDPSSNGVSKLLSSLTINSTSNTPKFLYYGGDATTTQWTASTYGVTLTATAGAGSDDVSINQGSPLLGTDDDSVLGCSNCDSMAATDSGVTGDATTGDIVVEVIVEAGNSGSDATVIDHINDLVNGPGWAVVENAGVYKLRIQPSATIVDVSTAALTEGAWYHIMWFADRSGSGQAYVNGVASGSAQSLSTVTASLTTTYNLALLARPTVGAEYPNRVAYASMWTDATWLDTHLQAAVALARFHALIGVSATAKGTADPSVCDRTGPAATYKTSGGVTTAFQVGEDWVRSTQLIAATGLLLERSVENFARQSQSFESGWQKTRAAVGINVLVSPGIRKTADSIKGDTENASHYIRQSDTLTIANYWFSAWAKSGAETWISLKIVGTAANCFSMWDLSDCSKGTDGVDLLDSFQEDHGNGWCRVAVKCLGAVSSTMYIFAAEADDDLAYIGTDTDDVYIWGAQVELDVIGQPTSYILTTTSSVTRNVDTLRYIGDDGNLGGVGSDKKGTIVVDWLASNFDNPVVFSLVTLTDGGISTDLIELFIDTTDVLTGHSEAAVGTDGDVTIAGDMTNGTSLKARLRWTTENMFASRAGIDGTQDTTVSPPDDLDRIDIGSDESGAQQSQGIIERIRIYATLVEP